MSDGLDSPGMRSPFYVFAFFLAVLPACAESSWLDMFSGSLRDVKKQQKAAVQKLHSLGKPMPGQTVQELGFIHDAKPSQESISHWVQVDLQRSHPIDRIVLVPVQMDWDTVGQQGYGFPKRFRVDISHDPEFAICEPAGVFTDADVESPEIAPLVLSVNSKSGRYVRVTVVSPRSFALAELMVISGGSNVAIGCPVSATHFVAALPRWDKKNLVDGRTPLGPPIVVDSVLHESLYAGPSNTEFPAWMGFDLKAAYPIDEIRLHPVHTRDGSDLPGHGFPTMFRMEVSMEPDFSNHVAIPDGANISVGHPGNNPVIIHAKGIKGRYVRMIVIQEGGLIYPGRFGLSEMEVYSRGVNIAPQAEVLAIEEPHPKPSYSKTYLNDGYTSYGRIVPLPEWIENWRQRHELMVELKKLEQEKTRLSAKATKLAGLWGIALITLLTSGGMVFLWNTRRKGRRDLEQFRKQIANDLHDEIGSNLAAIEMMSETSSKHPDMAPGYSPKINRIARETTRAMRETLWLAGFREEADSDFMEQLKLAAARILAGREYEWLAVTEALPKKWSTEKQRQVFLFFKEALTNAVRHSKATLVQLSAQVEATQFQLVIKDNGRGFSVDAAKRGVGMQSLKERASTSGGVMSIESSPGGGTIISLRTPLVG